MSNFFSHLPPTIIAAALSWLAAALSWLAYELRQWRIWYMQNHGGAPAEKQQGK